MPRLVGVDIGGTNTDLIFVDSDGERLLTAKLPTTAHDQADGLVEGLGTLGIGIDEINLLVHGTTVATNAAIERKGARCGLLTTMGFRDVLELRRRDRPNTYGLRGEFTPLVPRRDRREIRERMDADGQVLDPLDEQAVTDAARELAASGCEVLVVAFLHAYANSEHERRAIELARTVWPNDYLVCSSDVLPTIREFERTSTAVINGYVQPLIARYMKSLGATLEPAGLRRELLVVQSNGGVMAASQSARFAANTILSGPAAGVTAAAAIATDLGIANAVSCDIGGTSLDICIIRGGMPALTQQKAIDFGLPLGLPMLDVDAVGAGGGSLARIDRAGLLQVGPESAGADPGPACYGRGGNVPTVTDACLVLGLLDPDFVIGRSAGAVLDRTLAEDAIARNLCEPLGVPVPEAAEAILTVVGAKMAGHVRRKLLERGLDPRDFSVISFGGGGPLHANRLLREVGFARAVIPFYPGITSAMGCVLGRLRHDFLRTVNRPLSTLAGSDLATLCAEHIREGRALLGSEGVDGEAIEISFAADMGYRGQPNVIPVVFSTEEAATWEGVARAFENAYRERYGRLLEGVEPVLVNARTTTSGPSGLDTLGPFLSPPSGPAPAPRTGRVFFDGRERDAFIYDRHRLPAGTIVEGPAILLQADTTTFVEPGYRATVHPTGNILIEANP